MLYPLTFTPLFKERAWGGRNLERLFAKPLPPGLKIGESWEMVDRTGDVSVVSNGPLAGKTLRWLMEQHGTELLGTSYVAGGNFPILVKILDAEEKLSLQVHPPAEVAARLGGEPKTEFWHMVDCKPDADLFVGLKQGVTREAFEQAIQSGTLEQCFHRIPVQKGDSMFLPSGRVHAIGAGNVLFEIQQNSDTTYRVFDWNRMGLDGKPRELHVKQALQSITFEDVEPGLVQPEEVGQGAVRIQYLLDDPLFRINVTQVRRGQRFHLTSHGAQVLGLVSGRMEVTANGEKVLLKPGQFVLLPASLTRITFEALARVEFLQVQF